MRATKLQASRALHYLKSILDKDDKGSNGLSVNLEDDLATDKIKALLFTRSETDAIDKTVDALINNEGFEYLNFDLNKRILRLACEYVIKRDAGIFDKFLEDSFKEPENLRVYIPMEGLEVVEPVKIQKVTLRKLPIDGLDLKDNGYFEGIDSVAEVRVTGTDPVYMRKRALAIINYELKVLRVGLRAHIQIPDQQLRFRAGRGWAIENGRIGWSEHQDTGYSLGMNKELFKTVSEQPLYKIPYDPKTKIERKIKLAIEWLDQSRLATDPLMRLLYDMFALETILGDKAEGKKARNLAFRRALLSTIIHDHYPDPDKVFRLYEQVRSYAVHGEEIKEYNEKDAKSLSWSARIAVNEYLEIVRSNDFTRPKQVLDYLRNHDKHDELLDWLIKLDSSWRELKDAE